jgi:mono/diheme cytochrome c family protein
MRTRIATLTTWTFTVWMYVALLSSGVAAQVSTAAPGNQQAQIEKGRQVVAQVCTTCHTTLGRMIQVRKQTAEQWKETVYFMISRGAQVMPDEIEPVTAFLAATAGSGSQTSTQTSGRGRAGGGVPGQQPAEADGRAILQRNCQQCHELATASKKLASEDWRAVITRMVTYGARLTPADQQTLIGYLNGLEK